MKIDLRNALLEANLREFADAMEQPTEPTFSPRYRRSCTKMLTAPRSWANQMARPLWKKVLRTVACIALAFTLALGTLMGVSPTVRAAVMNWFRELTRTTIAYETEVHGPSDRLAALYRLTDLPQGWTVDRIRSDGYDCQWSYKNGDAWMEFRCIGPNPSEETNGPGASEAVIHTPDELLQSSHQTIRVQGCVGDFYEDADSALLVWERDGLLFWLRASGISRQDLQAFGEGIQLYQGPVWEVQVNWLPEGYQLSPAMSSTAGDSGQLEWRKKQHTISCIYSGTTHLRLPEEAAEVIQINGTEAKLWRSQGETALTIDVGNGTTVTVGGADQDSSRITVSWTDPDTGIKLCLTGDAEEEAIIHMAEALTLKRNSNPLHS